MIDQYPSPAWLQEAMVYPSDCLIPKRLKGAVVHTKIMGLPALFTGANSAVFKVELQGREYALKCFTQKDKNRNRRYRKLKKVLPTNASSPFVEMEYFRKGISFGNLKIPVLLYRWIDLPSIGSFVEDHLAEPKVLKMLSDALIDLSTYLVDLQIAHGDLQHGNVFVDYNSNSFLKIYLIDYDQMFCKSLRRVNSSEIGHRNFQHPDRDASHYSSEMDRFSMITIFISLQILICRPDFWSSYSNGENLLFLQSDFHHPRTSKIFDEVSKIDGLRKIANRFRSVCELQLSEIPSLKEFAESNTDFESKSNSKRTGKIDPIVEDYKTDDLEKTLSGLRKERAQLAKRLIEHKEKLVSENQAIHDRSLETMKRRALEKHSVGLLETEKIVSHKVVVRLKSFNLRNASDITQKSLDSIFGLAPNTKQKILEWVESIQPANGERKAIAVKNDLVAADYMTKNLEEEIDLVQERIESLEFELQNILDTKA